MSGMDFAYTQAQKDVAGVARKIFAEHPQDAWHHLASAGLLGTAVPETEGGSGFGLLELCVLLEEQGRATASAPILPALVGAALPIAAFGTPAQRRRWLVPLATGELVLGAALDGPPVHATPDGTGWRLDGVKSGVAAAERAARVLVPARTPAGGALLLLVDPRAAGVTLEAQTATTGEVVQQMSLARVAVPADELIAGSVDWLLARATVGLCALELGVVERALEMTARYTSERRQFDRAIGTFQAVAHRAADAYIDVEAIRLTLWQAAWLLSERRDTEAVRAVALAKFWAAEAGHRVVYAAQHLHGGIGFDIDYPLGRCYLWSKQIELSLGPASAQLARLGAALAKG